MANWLKWQDGRQRTGYQKCLLMALKWPVKLDMYLLRFSQGSMLPKHTDNVITGRHFRLNIVLKKAKSGGEFYCQQPIFETTRIKLFRPDEQAHSVTEIKQGTRYVFSLGWVLP